MKITGILTVILICVFLLSGCIGTQEETPEEEILSEENISNELNLIDCGVSTREWGDLENEAENCFKEAYSECTPAKLLLKTESKGIGMDTTAEILQEIRGGTKESCTLYMKYNKFSVDTDDEEISKTVKKMYDGKEITCTNVDVTVTLSIEEMDFLSSKDCVGSLKDAIMGKY